MARPVTLFTGQWADLPIEDICRKASDFGYNGIELACWGDHFEVNKADANYYSAKRSARISSVRPCAIESMHGTNPYCRRTCGATETRLVLIAARSKK